MGKANLLKALKVICSDFKINTKSSPGARAGDLIMTRSV